MRNLFLSLTAAVCFILLSTGLSRPFEAFSKPSPENDYESSDRKWPLAAAADPVKQAFTVEGQKRTALVFPPSRSEQNTGAPLVFVFHGHGGTAENSAKKFRIHELWPEAVVAYMQGLPGVEGINDPEGKKSGWQKDPGQLGDRDVKFFDVALEDLEKSFNIDADRVYALGHSNGGRFTNVLWNMRGEKFAAFCSAAGQGGLLITTSIPKPIFIIAGENDPLVPFEGQMMSVELARKLLQTDPSKAVSKGFATIEPGINGTELATYLHPGGHEFPKRALPIAVGFFQRHTRR